MRGYERERKCKEMHLQLGMGDETQTTRMQESTPSVRLSLYVGRGQGQGCKYHQ